MIVQYSGVTKPPTAQLADVLVRAGFIVNRLVFPELVIADERLRTLGTTKRIAASQPALVVLPVIVFVPSQHETTIKSSCASRTGEPVGRLWNGLRVKLLVDVFVPLPDIRIPESLLASRARVAHFVAFLSSHSLVIVFVLGKLVCRLVRERTQAARETNADSIDRATLGSFVHQFVLAQQRRILEASGTLLTSARFAFLSTFGSLMILLVSC